MRRLLSLHQLAGDAHPVGPQPGLDDVEDLVTRARAAGLATVLRVGGTRVDIASSVDLCAYRIIQEALTNAIKHAGPAHAVVRLDWAGDSLLLEISDDGAGVTADRLISGGHGLIGMRERVSLHGGVVEACPADQRGFVVRARLPLLRDPTP
jgi:signal transduction histidine kinase